MHEVSLHRGSWGRPMVYRHPGYRNRSTQVAPTGPIAATQVATAAATGLMGLPGWHGNSRSNAHQN